MRLDVQAKVVSKRYCLQITRWVWQRSTDKL